MIQFQWMPFAELSIKTLYDILALRAEVFVLGQGSAYQDPDGKDFSALHVLGIEKDLIAAYARVFLPTKTQPAIVFGRVLTAPSARNKGYGKQLIQEIIAHCDTHFPNIRIQCSAQYYLKNFYNSFGFKEDGDIYDDVGVPHIKMFKE